MMAISVRQIKGDVIGKLAKIKGIVTRVSNVKPLAVVSAYSCDACGNEVFQEVSFMRVIYLYLLYHQTKLDSLNTYFLLSSL